MEAAVPHPKVVLVVPELSKDHLSLGLAAGTVTPMIKAELHRLVDALPDESLPAAAILLLRRAQDPIAAKLDAPPNHDEDFTDEDFRSVKEARNEPSISLSDAEA